MELKTNALGYEAEIKKRTVRTDRMRIININRARQMYDG